MVTTVYIDSLFVLNTLINYLLLLATARLTDRPIKRWRLFLGAVLGGIYAIVVFLPPFHFLISLVGKILVALLMTLVASGGAPWIPFIKYTLCFWGVSFALGGCILALGALSGKVLLPNGVPAVNIHMPTLVLGVAVSYGLLTLVFRRSARHGGLSRDLAEVEASSEGKSITFTALCDTGNTLRDPLSGCPIMIVELQHLTALWSPLCRALVDVSALRDPTRVMEQLYEVGQSGRFRLVPYRAVGVDSGLLLAYKPDHVRVGKRIRHDLLLAVAPTRLSDGAAFSAVVGV